MPLPEGVTVQSEKLEKSQVSLTVEVPGQMVDSTFTKVLNRLARTAKIEGFRPGKAPVSLVESRVGHAAVREEVVETLVGEVLDKVMDDQHIHAIDRPRVDMVELERGQNAKFRARISVFPDVSLADLDHISVELKPIEATDEMVEKRIEELRERSAEIVPVEREVRPGDIAVADLEVIVDGSPVESESRKAVEMEVKEGVLVPELLGALPGAFVGDTVEAPTTLPADHSNADLAGKAAVLKVTVQGVKEKSVPELDDALAEQLSDGKQKTVAEFREAVRQEVVSAAETVSRLAKEQAVVKSVVEGSSVEVPDVLIEREVHSQAHDTEERLLTQGVRLDRYLEYQNTSLEDWLAAMRPGAESRLRTDLVLDAVTEKLGIDVTEDELTEYTRDQVKGDPDLEKRTDEVLKNENLRRYFRVRLIRSKTVDALVERAKVVSPA